MTEVDCAQNNELAEELTIFLRNEDYSVTQENDLVSVDKKLSKSILESFLKKTDRVKHKITPIDSDSYIIAIPLDLEDIGLESCEFCGYTAYRELVEIHRRSHQGL